MQSTLCTCAALRFFSQLFLYLNQRKRKVFPLWLVQGSNLLKSASNQPEQRWGICKRSNCFRLLAALDGEQLHAWMNSIELTVNYEQPIDWINVRLVGQRYLDACDMLVLWIRTVGLLAEDLSWVIWHWSCLFCSQLMIHVMR